MKKIQPPSAQSHAPVSFSLHKASHDPRAAALVAVAKVLAREADAQGALDLALQSDSMVPTDKGLCTELLYGQLRMHIRLQWFCERYLRKPDKLPWEMRLCLEQALYSMAFLRIPHRAAVHWAVEHVRHRFGQSLAKVANGALRSMQRDLASFKERDVYFRELPSEDEALARWYSMPAWIVRLWQQAYGKEKCLALLEISSYSSPQGIRLNRACKDWEEHRKALLLEGGNLVGQCGFLFEHTLPYSAKELVASGRASRQSGTSYAALEFFEPQTWPQPIWDCCAGRGGKTLALLEQGVAVALASDPFRQRLQALPHEYARLELACPPCPRILSGAATAAFEDMEPLVREPSHTSLEQDANIPELYGTILADAPCSGLGTLGRRPEIRYRRGPEDCERLAATQKSILNAAWARLLPGGRLIYITCTANPAENELQIADFLAGHPEAELVKEYPASVDRELGEFFYGAMLQKADGK